ncbi:uncharacterized protein LOC118647689 [Monomorium pharaonis]|uniref:uncharacterized protein LOC118647689 n=1 Tax=Monomorium pharaonis TaxID=307658 RepID=UPI001746C75C|nr:uncharacterized protein LOC118647689 [Monomorium pharaonis]
MKLIAPKKDQLKTTRLVMSKIDPGKDWNTYNLRFHHYYSTYNIAVKAAKNVLEGNVARTEVETDYDQPRKRKKNKKYIESSDEDEDNPPSNIFCSASNKVPAPNPLLPNKIKTLFKNKSMKTSMICQQKDTSVGKLFSRKESRVTSLSPSKLTYKTTLDENPMKHHSMLEENDKNDNEQYKNFNTIHSETLKEKSEDDVLKVERTILSTNNENEVFPKSPLFQGLSNADRDLLTTTLSHLKKLHGSVVSNLDRDLLRNVSSKLDIVLMNQRRILNEIFPGEAILDRPKNCPPLPLPDEKSFEEFNEFLENKVAFSQFVSYLNALINDCDQWNVVTRLMSNILHNELARQVSWKGTRGVKISFYGTRIKEALFCKCFTFIFSFTYLKY